MTDQQQPEPNGNRLDRIEAAIEANGQQIEKNTDAIIDLRVAVSSLIETSNQFQRNFEVMAAEIVSLRRDFTVMQGEIREINEEIREIKLDIRGLQVENRRILDRFFGQEENGETGESEN